MVIGSSYRFISKNCCAVLEDAMFYPTWMKRLSESDTKLTKDQRRKEFWYIFEIAGVFINWEPRYYILHVIYAGLSFSALSYYFPCFIMTMVNVDDIAAKGQYLNFASLILFALSIMITFQFKRDSLLTLLSLNAQGVYDYGNTINYIEIEQMEKLFKLLKKIILLILPSWLMLVGGSVIFSSYIDKIFQYETEVEQDYDARGVYQRPPLKMWYFHTIDSELERLLTHFFGLICASELALAIGSANLLLIFFGQTIIIQMRTLIIAFRDIDSRADQHYSSVTGKKPPTNPILRRKSTQLMRSYKACLRQTMEHHKVILYYFEHYNDGIKWPTGVGVITGAVMIGMSLITVMQGGGQPSSALTSYLLFIAEIVTFFFLCEIGQAVTNQSEEMFNIMYNCQWSDCSKEVVTAMRIMRTRMAKPFVMFGLITPLNRVTYSKMLNSAYSYVNLMRASNEHKAI